MNNCSYINHRKIRGVTMIEVLVALVILSVGLLGIAALQLTGLRSTANASFRTKAAVFADDISERMTANPTAIDNNLFMAVNSSSIDCTTLPTPYCGQYYGSSSVIAAASCTPTQLAAYDINVWFCGESSSSGRSGIADSLPNATASITCNDSDVADADACTDGSPHTISLNWTEVNPNRTQGAPATITQNISIYMQP